MSDGYNFLVKTYGGFYLIMSNAHTTWGYKRTCIFIDNKG